MRAQQRAVRMSMFKIRTLLRKHTGGTKEYHLVSIVRKDGRSLVINRWGKTGAWGQMNVSRHGTDYAAQRALQEKQCDKERRDYKLSHDTGTVTINTENTFKRDLGD